MVAVPCECGKSVRIPAAGSTTRTEFNSQGVAISTTEQSWGPGPSATADKQCHSGSKVGNWSPTRPYVRTASVVNFQPGLSVYRKNSPVYSVVKREYRGYPEPQGIWYPARELHWPCEFGDGSSVADAVPLRLTISQNRMNRLKTELLVKAGERKVNYGEAIGESRETLSMIARTAIKVFRAIIAARHLNWRGVAKALGVKRLSIPKGTTVANGWLQYQYGWKPLLSDIYDSSKLLQTGLRNTPQLLSVTRVLTTPSGSSVSAENWSTATISGTLRSVAKMWFRVRDVDLSYAHQLGLINPAEVAWALVPFSFVIDWFLPVGSMLEALSARMGLSFVDGYYGHKAEINSSMTGLKKVIPGYTLVSGGGSVHGRAINYTRQKMVSMPWPGLYTKSPFSNIHTANALALLTTLRRG